uniref:2-Hacid_dh_C domain-containing protein n=1 Tax=Gongylonema pulchrum TaxID=637853 RepID=A0A183D5I1_9BILA
LTEVTAETTVALLLATARRLPEAVNEAKTGKWGAWSLYYMCGVGVHQSTVGIVGMGRIGVSVAEKLKAFKPARMLYHNRKPNNESIVRYFPTNSYRVA